MNARDLDRHITGNYGEDSVESDTQPAVFLAACPFELIPEAIAAAGAALVHQAHGASIAAGWWYDRKEGIDLRAEINSGSRFGKALAAEKLALIHSETSEALEGHRKGAMDKHLPHRTNEEVELADAMIRIADYAGARGYDLGGAIAEKMAYNAVRPDHKPEARAAAGGKSY